MREFENLYSGLQTLAVFRDLKKDPVFQAFYQFTESVANAGGDKLEKYCAFAGLLYNTGHTDNWTQYLKDLVLSLENPCSYFASAGKKIPDCMEKTARQELRILSDSCIPSSAAMQCIFTENTLPEWTAEPVDLEMLYFSRLSEITKHGYGIFSRYQMFHMEQNDSEKGYCLKPVQYPDAVSLEELIGYEFQRNQVIDNVKALLRGKKAANTLLYGDAGTGKSATVKAVANAYAGNGLRLIELGKKQLHLLPKLLDELSSNPLKFILFIDDLSFQDNDDDFSALKAVLEGSISARSHNTVIFATSNRRHIVRETFSSREGDEIHRKDTMQETISLSERFGLSLCFDKPNKEQYLHIVQAIANQQGLAMDGETLALKAEQFALRKSGRSARAARQLVEQLAAAEYEE